jgi:hypothetical protein
MKFRHRKPLASAPTISDTEVTVTIMERKEKHNRIEYTNFHQTFRTSEDHFEYKGKLYNLPIEDTEHYPIGFWSFGRKLGLFYEQHQTLARFFDWFKFASKATFEVGYLYEEGTADPFELIIKNPLNYVANQVPVEYGDWDWGKVNYLMEKNSTIKGSYKDVDDALRGEPKVEIGKLLIIAIIAFAVIAGIIGAYYIFGVNHSGVAQQIQQNITAASPTPFGGIQ